MIKCKLPRVVVERKGAVNLTAPRMFKKNFLELLKQCQQVLFRSICLSQH